MRERVSCILGKNPIVLLCPHGPDDTNTDVLTEAAAKFANCYAIINRGFERNDTVDVENDLANCNRVDHIQEEVVFDEYLNPILKLVERLSRPAQIFDADKTVHIFHIHGCGDIVHKETNDEVQVVVGYGRGKLKDSLTCDIWRKNLFVDLYADYRLSTSIYEAQGGSRYAGRDSNNMNQYFRKWNVRSNVQSMQLEFPFSVREKKMGAEDVGDELGATLLDYLTFNSYEGKEKNSHFI